MNNIKLNEKSKEIKNLMKGKIAKEVDLLLYKDSWGIGCKTYIVLCKFKGKKKYVTWLLNASAGSLNYGNYFEDYFNELSDKKLYDMALENFNNRK